MNVYQLVQVVALAVVVACFPFIIYWLNKARRYNRITSKLLSREPLTDREQRLLDGIKS